MEYLYEWTKNIAFYMVVVTLALQLVPGQSFQKYIRFFVGLVLIFMLARPMLTLFGMTEEFEQLYRETKVQQEHMEREWKDDQTTRYFEEKE